MLRKRSYKNTVALVIDLLGVIVAYLISSYIRFGGEAFFKFYVVSQNQLILLVVITAACNFYFNIHRGIWRYFGAVYLYQIIKSVTLATLLFVLVSFLESRLDQIPRSVIVLNWFLIIFFIVLPRVLYRSFYEKDFSFVSNLKELSPAPILIVGLTPTSVNYISGNNSFRSKGFKIVGIIDELSNVGRAINNIPILGCLEDLPLVIEELEKKNLRPTKILVSAELYVGKKLAKLLKFESKLSIPVFKIPSITELNKTSPLQSISLEELLGRKQRTLDFSKVAHMVKGRKVIVTGAGGSIGSEIVRQVASLGPSRLYLVDYSEFLLYEIQQECIGRYQNVKIKACLADIRDVGVVDSLFDQVKADLVFHAAALKHVPLLEDHKIEAIETNIFGTMNLLNAAVRTRVKKFVFISTDKAVDPLSFMGTTKRIAELYCQVANHGGTVISIVRFGNVLGSNGSVVPLFQKQIAAGGPVTVTDINATRYFMTISEAVGLVLQAATINESSETASTFILDMGEPVNIYDLAQQMITLAGLRPNIDIEIKIIGLRPGEKLHEILVTEQEPLTLTSHKDIFLAQTTTVEGKQVLRLLEKLKKSCRARSEKECVNLTRGLVKKLKLTTKLKN